MSQTIDTVKNPSPLAKHAGGRPRVYDREKVWAEVLRLIADEGESLPGALARLAGRRLSLSSAKQMLKDDHALRQRYEIAVADRADVLGERLITLADEPLPKGLTGPELLAAVNMRRLQIDVRKFVAAKLSPRKWSEKLQVEVDTHKSVSITLALEQAQARVNAALADEVEDAVLLQDPVPLVSSSVRPPAPADGAKTKKI